MSKNINTDRMNTEKDLAKLMEEIKKQGLGTVVEINDFLKNIQGKSLDDLPERTDKKGRSQDLELEHPHLELEHPDLELEHPHLDLEHPHLEL
jgi:hypothetical protein